MKIEDQTTLKKKLKDGYFICFACARDNGAKSDGGCHTCSSQKCTICEETKTCNAITDWHWPKEVGVGYIWD